MSANLPAVCLIGSIPPSIMTNGADFQALEISFIPISPAMK